MTITIDEAYELVDMLDEYRAEAAAEAGSGAMSLGYGTDGAYAAAAEARERIAVTDEERAARALIAEHTVADRIRRPVIWTPASRDDLPF